MFEFALISLALCFIHNAAALKNPIIPGWNPDPAVIRVGGEYFIATSSFEYFPGMPIYRSTDLANWELFSPVLTRLNQLQLFGTPTGAGVWAPSLTHINGRFYLACTTRWTYDPVARVWPRVMWLSSSDLKDWSDPVWAEPWGIDPQLFQDPKTRKVYLNLMAPNNNVDRIWGISQCEVDVEAGRCVGAYRSLWNGTLPHNASARPEGPKMFFREPWYYLLIAEGGTDEMHRSSIARSQSPEGPWVPAPNNPVLFNGGYGFDNLTVQSTGHADIVEAEDGSYYASFIARRTVNGSSPLGRETFLCPVEWEDGWPRFNGGNPILLSESFGLGADQESPLQPFVDKFEGVSLDPSWYRLRSPYTEVYQLAGTEAGGIALKPNVFGLSDRDQPAAILRKQKSLNMTFTARLTPIIGGLGHRQSVGISAYLSELQHQDVGVRACANTTGLCVYTMLLRNGTTEETETPLNSSDTGNMALSIRATPSRCYLGFSVNSLDTSMHSSPANWITSIKAAWLAFAPEGYFVFSGASFALFASGNGEPWLLDGSEVGFLQVEEIYFREDIGDFQTP